MILHMLAFRFCDWIWREIVGERQCLLVPQPIALQRANFLGDLFVCEILWLVSFVSLACFCNVVQLNSYLFAFPIHFFGEGAG